MCTLSFRDKHGGRWAVPEGVGPEEGYQLQARTIQYNGLKDVLSTSGRTFSGTSIQFLEKVRISAH